MSVSDDVSVDENAPDYQEKVKRIEYLSKKLVRLARRVKAVQEADIDCVEMEKWGNLYVQVCYDAYVILATPLILLYTLST